MKGCQEKQKKATRVAKYDTFGVPDYVYLAFPNLGLSAIYLRICTHTHCIYNPKINLEFPSRYIEHNQKQWNDTKQLLPFIETIRLESLSRWSG